MKQTDYVQSMLNKLSQLGSLSKKEMEGIRAIAKIQKYKRGACLSRDGMLHNYLWYIIEGVGRYKLINESGLPFTVNFFFEGDFVRDTFTLGDSLFLGSEIEALTELTTVQLKIDLFTEVLAGSTKAETILKEFTQLQLVQLQKRILSWSYTSKLKIYEHLLQAYPGIDQRISQRMIASYLDISPAHLSRLKTELRHKNQNSATIKDNT